MQPVISLENIEKSYGPDRALGPISLTLNAGEIVGVVGKNGAGKSTLIRLMAGVERPDAGEITVKALSAGETGYVPQELALYEALTGRQNLNYWAMAVGLPAKRRRVRVDYLLDFFDLRDKADKRVSAYSGGMKRRLNLAAALVGDVKLLLLDEPTVGADDASVERIFDAIKKQRELGCAIVLVTHHKDEIRRTADRIIELDGGRLV